MYIYIHIYIFALCSLEETHPELMRGSPRRAPPSTWAIPAPLLALPFVDADVLNDDPVRVQGFSVPSRARI